MSPLTSQPLTMSNSSRTATGSKGSLVISSSSSETVLSGGKIKVISGEKKHYSPFRSRGKMMPLMHSSKSDEDDEEDEEDDDKATRTKVKITDITMVGFLEELELEGRFLHMLPEMLTT